MKHLIFFILLALVFSKSSPFKKCHERDFCERLRKNEPTTNFKFGKILESKEKFEATIQDENNSDMLNLKVDSFSDGIIRVKLVEDNPAGNYGPDGKKIEPNFRLNLDGDILIKQPVNLKKVEDGKDKIVIESSKDTSLKINKEGQLKLEFFSGKKKLMVLNNNNMLHMDSWFYQKTENDTWADGERSAYRFDLSFTHNANSIYGIPQRTKSLNLPDTNENDEPYRMFNLDVFEYEIDSNLGIYGSIPFLMSLNKDGISVGAFLLNPTETFVDIKRERSGGKNSISSKWYVSNGEFNLFMIPGNSPSEVIQKFVSLTGKPFFPPKFSLGYHQCRWNYKDEDDVSEVNSKFNEHDIPMDMLWLDIEHTDHKKYFTWDKDFFPTPLKMQDELRADGRKLVTISDPHIKVESGYFLHDEATQKRYFVKDKNGNDYSGDCWPGKSSWLDFYNPEVRNYYSSLFSFDKYQGSSDVLYTWIDMNEPSVFGGPEVTMPLDNLHYGDVQHREIHNVYGYYHAMATFQGHLDRNEKKKRPFILTRSFFAGSQKYASVWTGDNAAEWSHLEKSVPMLLSLGISGLPFVGADVGGFFGNPSEELMTRWYQMATFYPFFRQHAHLETKRREPYLFGEENLKLWRTAIVNRYKLLPYLYTQFYKSSQTGLPILQPLMLQNPEDPKTHDMDDEFFFGDSILAKPITKEKAKSENIYFPEGEWFDYENGEFISNGKKSITKNVDITTVPVYQKGGSIIPLRERVRRSSVVMKNDPFTLQIALDKDGNAKGDIYVDDGETYDYMEKGEYILKTFEFNNNRLNSHELHNGYPDSKDLMIEKLRIFNFKEKPSKIIVAAPKDKNLNIDINLVLDFDYDAQKKVLTVKNPQFSIADDYEINFIF